MSEKDIVRILASARFKFRSDTLENWQTENPVLLSGEFGVVTDGNEIDKVKIGDGVTPWNQLGWWRGGQGDKGDKGDQGIQGEKGEKGDAYVLTQSDKNEIADIVIKNFIDVSEVGR